MADLDEASRLFGALEAKLDGLQREIAGVRSDMQRGLAELGRQAEARTLELHGHNAAQIAELRTDTARLAEIAAKLTALLGQGRLLWRILVGLGFAAGAGLTIAYYAENLWKGLWK